MGDTRPGKRLPLVKIVKIDENHGSIYRSESEETAQTSVEPPNKRPKLEPKTEEFLIDPSVIPYTPLVLAESEDQKLRQDIINDPVRGYFYYEYLGDKLGTVLRYLTKKSGINLLRNKVQYLTFKDWDQFVNEYRFIPHDKEIWRKIGNKIDIFGIASNAVTYRKGLVELMNSIYLGYTEGKNAMNWELADRLIFFISKCSKNYTKNLNIQYYKLLSKEFKEFFGFQSGFGNKLENLIERESLYIHGDDINEANGNDALKWTADEKDIFYESLARYGIARVDDIAALLPNKSSMDVMNLYNALSKKLSEYKSDKKLRKKLLTAEDMPIAYEMSDMYVEMEEKFAGAIEKLDEAQFSGLHGEYRGKYYKEIATSCEELFNTKNMEKLLHILNGLNGDHTELRTQSVVEFALLDMYNLIREYIYELILRLFRRKMNELTIPQHYEWNNFLKSLKTPPDPKRMVRILNLKNINQKVNEEIDYFESNNDDETDEENDFYLEPSKKELELMKKLNPQGIQIMDDLDMWKIGITKEEVYEASEELLKEYNCSNELWMQLRGKVKPTKKAKHLDGKEPGNSKLGMSGSENETTDGNSDSESLESDDNKSQGNSSSSEFEDEDLKYMEMLSNAQDIDDLQSDDELQPFVNGLNSRKEAEKHLVNNSPGEKMRWYDDEFIILDSNTGIFDKAQNKIEYVSGLDTTTKGHEYLQDLCDYEERELERKDLEDSLKYEHLLLTQLSSREDEDELNSKTYADLFSQLQYGGDSISTKSWKPEHGGPSSMFGNLKVKQNVNRMVTMLQKRLGDFAEEKKPPADMVENFKYTYND